MLRHGGLPLVLPTSSGFHFSGTAPLEAEVHWLPLVLLPPHLPLASFWPSFFSARFASFVLPWAVRFFVIGVAAAFACIAIAGRDLRAAHIRRMPRLSALLAHCAFVQDRTACC